MKTMTADAVRQLALRTGGEAVIGGKPFNTARAVVDARPTPKTPAAQNLLPTPPVQTFSRAEVDQMLAEQERRLTDRMTQLFASLARPAETADGDELKPAGLRPTYNPDGSIQFIGIDWQRMQ